MNREPIEDAADQLAELFARRRTGGHVYMDGKHNPLPTERLDAMRFVEDLIGQGWRAEGQDLASVLDDALEVLEGQCCPAPGTAEVITRARPLLGLPE